MRQRRNTMNSEKHCGGNFSQAGVNEHSFKGNVGGQIQKKEKPVHV